MKPLQHRQHHWLGAQDTLRMPRNIGAFEGFPELVVRCYYSCVCSASGVRRTRGFLFARISCAAVDDARYHGLLYLWCEVGVNKRRC